MAARSLLHFVVLTGVCVLLGAAEARASTTSTAPVMPTFFLAWGGGGSAAGQLTTPLGVATDALGNVYVTDAGNARIEKFDYLGRFILQWGSLGSANGQLSNPAGIAVDASGNVFVVDQTNSRIQKFSATGTYLTKWGTIGTGAGQFNTPVAVATDVAGNVYVTDYGHRVQKFTNAGAFVSQFGSGGAGPGQFNFPAGIAVDRGGNIYVADYLNHRVQKFNAAGTYLTEWGGNGASVGQLNLPYGISVDAVGHVYVGEVGNQRVQEFTNTGTSLTTWGSLGSANGQFSGPRGLNVDPAGNVYVTDSGNNRVQKFSGSGAAFTAAAPTFVQNMGGPGNGNGQFASPYAVATDAAGFLYIADTGNNRIQKLNALGTYFAKWTSTGGSPNGIAVDNAGNIFVACLQNTIVKYNSAGAVASQWGSPGAGIGQFNAPYGIAVDPAGYVYVTDQINNRVQKFTNSGTYVGQWGGAGSGNGQFDFPWGIAVDPAGNVYVGDSHDRVQKFAPGGTFLMQWSVPASGYNIPGIAADAAGDLYVTDRSPGSTVRKYRSDGTLLATFGSYGSGNGQFFPSFGIAADPFGNIYVTDYNNARILKWATQPSIALVSDVTNDQGRQVRLRITRASMDSPVSDGVSGYAVYRRVDALPYAIASADARGSFAAPAGTDNVALAGWDYVATQPAAGDAEYSMVVPTLADANTTSTEYSAFMVRALTGDPLTHYDSQAEYGYSVDNLPPGAPGSFSATYSAPSTHLHWAPSTAADFATYRIYRGASADFVPASGNLLAAVADTGYADAGAGSWYKISAVDLNGNESPFATVGPAQTTDVGGGPTLAFGLEPVRPNPIAGRAVDVAFTLARSLPARVDLIDIAGRRVAGREVGTLGVGRHVVRLADAGRLAPGLYMVRLSQGGESRVGRALVLN